MDTMIKTGILAPDFELPDLEGKLFRLSDWRGKIVVVNFWSAECPWAEKADRELNEYQSAWGEEVSLWSVVSNANESRDLLLKAAVERGLPFVLHDANQQIADLYGALTTPHLFILDRGGILRYQGAFNDVTFRQRTPTRHYLREAVEALMDSRNPDPAQTQSYGCSIVRY